MNKRSGKINHAKNATALFNSRKDVFNMLYETVRGTYKLSPLTMVVLIAALSYIILPLDFDWIPLVGWIDDGFVAYWLIKRLLHETKRYNNFRFRDRNQQIIQIK